MAMVINSNIQSLNAQRHLNNSLDAQNTATERLSSGLRINSAKDDAAGLAIANRMTSQVEGLNQAIRNANDGAALIQTAEGGLEETTNILQRMRELSIQSANGTYDTGNRDTLNAEVKQLKMEIDRISETTSFNGLSILDGTLGDIDLQVGENANQTIALSIEASNTKSLGSGAGADIVGKAVSVSAALALADGAGEFVVNGIDIDTLPTASVEAALEAANSQLKGSAEIGTQFELTGTTSGDGILSGTDNIKFDIVKNDGSTTSIEIRNTNNLEELAEQVTSASGGLLNASINDEGNLTLSAEGVATVTATETGATTVGALGAGFVSGTTNNAALTITAASGIDGVTVTYGTAANAAVAGIDQRQTAGAVLGQANAAAAAFDQGDLILNGVEINAFVDATDYNGDGVSTAGEELDLVARINEQSDETGVTASLQGTLLQLESSDGSEISIEYRAGQEAAMKGILGLEETNAFESAGANVASIDISTAEGAQKAISILDEAIGEVSAIRGDLGAISNRLDYTTSNLANISENAAAARSQIMDADFAEESANLSRAQVLQQAGNAMLAQANSRPQQVLSLLQ